MWEESCLFCCDLFSALKGLSEIQPSKRPSKSIWPPPFVTFFPRILKFVILKVFWKPWEDYALIFYNINLCFNLQYFFCRRFYTGSLLSSCRHSRSSCNGHYSSRYLNLSPQPHWVCLRESKGDKSKFIAWKKEYLWSDGGKIMTNVWGYCQSFITANNM